MGFCKRTLPWIVGAHALLAVPGCAIEDAEIPPGMLARVRSTVLGPQDLAAARAQLGAYAQQRFRGPEGQRLLLEALIDAELMAQAAMQHLDGADPGVEFAILEEIATVHASAELERRVPREAIASDTAALRAEYERRRDAFVQPARRSATGLVFETFGEAEAALEALRRGDRGLEGDPDVLSTEVQVRDDAKFPLFHPILFDPALGEGDWLSSPVVVGYRAVMAGRVHTLEPASLLPFEDPAVQEALVAALRGPRVDAARAAWMRELAATTPLEPAESSERGKPAAPAG